MNTLPDIAGVSHSFINVNNCKLHVAEAGKGKPLLLLHGWPQHWYMWRKIIPLLKNNFRLIMPDLPGLGWSEMPNDKDFRKKTLAKYLPALLDVLKLKQVDLVGHDWGGWIGFLACLQSPERFNKFLALGIYPPLDKIRFAITQNRRFLYQLPLATPFVGTTVLRLFPWVTEWAIQAGAYKKDAWTQEDLRIFSKEMQKNAEASSLLYRQFLTKEMKAVFQGNYNYNQLSVSTHLLIGNEDPVIHPALFSDYHHDMIRISYVKQCGHFIPEEQPEVVAKEIKELFK
jgi:pimeloyl-ACP methyl ester carboxylesterase